MAQYGGVHAQRAPTGATQTLQETANALTAPPPQQVEVTLVLRPRKKVSWDAETVDNEHMQKKSSKICCVFHKKEKLEDSSDEEDGCGDEGKGKGPCFHQGDEGDDSEHEGKGKGHFNHPSTEIAESSGKAKE